MKRYFTFRNLHIQGGAALALSIAAIAALALLIGLASAGVGSAQAQQAADTPTPAPTAASVPPVTFQEAQFELELPERTPPLGNLDSTLSHLARQVQRGYSTAHAAAAEAPLHQGDSVAVTFYTQGNTAPLVSFLTDNGADPRNIGEDYVDAYVPVDLLAEASEQTGVVSARAIVPPQPLRGSTLSQGVAAHGADRWHAAGYTGAGVKVGVIDTGFEGLTDLMGNELPPNVIGRCYTDIGVHTSDIADCQAGGFHGTTSAEILADVAPNVTLYIANPPNWSDLRETVRWMVAQDVDVINQSLGWIWDGAGDGAPVYSNSPLRSVNMAVSGGIVWANSAGNEGQSTYFGPFTNPDSDDFLNFSGSNERNGVNLEANDLFIAQLRWEGDWFGAEKDLILLLYDSRGQVVRRSDDFQLGRRGDTPFEFLRYTPPASETYYLAVAHAAGDVPDWVQLQAFGGEVIQFHTPGGGITSPAESANPGLLAVGAARWDDVNTIQYFSSRGPTPDGRTKPDIVGADRVETHRYRYVGGTSISSPHIAGMAALTLQAFPGYTPQQTANYLKSNASPRGAVPNNTWGYGFARMPDPPDGPPEPTPTGTPFRPTPSATPYGTPEPTPSGTPVTPEPTPSGTPVTPEPTPTNTPARGSFTEISSGANHVCGLRANGAIACWGSNASGQATPPSAGKFTSISSGDAHTCALRDDGAVVCWGGINGVYLE